MRYEETLHLNDEALELPTEKGRVAPFGVNGSIYTIRADNPGAWTVLGSRGEIMVSFVERDGLFVEKDEYTGDGESGEDWRNLLANFV